MGHEIWSIYNTKPVFRNINILHLGMIKLTHPLRVCGGFLRFLPFWAGFAIIFGLALPSFLEATVLAKTVAPKIFSHLAQKISNFFTTSPVPRMSGQAFKVTGPRMAANYGLEIQASSFNQ